MKQKIALFILCSLLYASLVTAKDITLSVNQTDYYFLIGEQAVVPLYIDNSYGKQIDGMISYTITQEMDQGGMHFSSTNTQSKSYTAEIGNNQINMGFGTSEQPMTLKVSLSFNYNENESRVVNLDEITIHFVSDQSQKQNQQNQKQSSSQQASQQNQNSPSQQMQDQINQLLNQEPQQQTTQQKLQNNQMNQDSTALKQQMQKQMQDEQKLQEDFARTLGQNQEFQQQHQQMLQQGYQQTPANLNPVTNNTGDFEINYQKGNETASLKGSMQNGNLTELYKTSSEDTRKLLEQLENDSRFQKYNTELQQELYTRQNPELTQEDNATIIKVPYMNQKNESASITARFQNSTIKEITLVKPEQQTYWWLLLTVLFVVFLSYFVYIKYFRKKAQADLEKPIVEKPIDYTKEAQKMLEEAKLLYSNKKEKDAYGKAAEALRFYYSYKLNVKIEITNFKLLKLLKKNKITYKNTQDCLNLCSLVEFAKYTANQKDFDEIVRLAEQIIV